jgi:hypothetical protein
MPLGFASPVHGATTAGEIGSSTAARGDRSAARRAVGGVAGPGSAKGGRWSCGTGVCADPERSKGSTAISDTLVMRHVCGGVGCV